MAAGGDGGGFDPQDAVAEEDAAGAELFEVAELGGAEPAFGADQDGPFLAFIYWVRGRLARIFALKSGRDARAPSNKRPGESFACQRVEHPQGALRAGALAAPPVGALPRSWAGGRLGFARGRRRRAFRSGPGGLRCIAWGCVRWPGTRRAKTPSSVAFSTSQSARSGRRAPTRRVEALLGVALAGRLFPAARWRFFCRRFSEERGAGLALAVDHLEDFAFCSSRRTRTRWWKTSPSRFASSPWRSSGGSSRPAGISPLSPLFSKRKATHSPACRSPAGARPSAPKDCEQLFFPRQQVARADHPAARFEAAEDRRVFAEDAFGQLVDQQQVEGRGRTQGGGVGCEEAAAAAVEPGVQVGDADRRGVDVVAGGEAGAELFGDEAEDAAAGADVEHPARPGGPSGIGLVFEQLDREPRRLVAAGAEGGLRRDVQQLPAVVEDRRLAFHRRVVDVARVAHETAGRPRSAGRGRGIRPASRARGWLSPPSISAASAAAVLGVELGRLGPFEKAVSSISPSGSGSVDWKPEAPSRKSSAISRSSFSAGRR